MDYRKLGRTGLKVSPLCLGTMQFGWTADETLSFRILSAALEAGINFIDTADIYSRWVTGNPGGVSETILGKWMKQAGVPRDRLVIATKVRGRMGNGPNDEGLSRAHILQAVEASLRRLGTDYIDLYQTHWPDNDTPIDETLRALDDLVHAGKVRYIGASNYAAWQLMQALWTSDRLGLARFDVLQPHYNLIVRAEFEAELRAVCAAYQIGVIPYSPLAGGFLTGKYRRNQPLPDSVRAASMKDAFTEQNWALLETMDELARVHEATISQIALAWLLADPLITSPIIGPRTIEQLQDNLGCLHVELTPEEKTTLDRASAWRQETD
ncbi:MAG: aldo/keto reductase [Candidatus Villigracilaceae bacterium]